MYLETARAACGAGAQALLNLTDEMQLLSGKVSGCVLTPVLLFSGCLIVSEKFSLTLGCTGCCQKVKGEEGTRSFSLQNPLPVYC